MTLALALRPYQENAIGQIRQAFAAGSRRILCVMPTGSGKTSVQAQIVRNAAVGIEGTRKLRVAVCAHRQELVGQLSARLDLWGVSHGVIQSGHPRVDRDALAQVCSVPTLSARGEAPEVDGIIFDEAHHVVARTWQEILTSYPSLKFVIGFTATPERGDRAPMGDMFDSLVVPVSVAELQALGYLLPVDVISPGKTLKKKELAEHPVDAYFRLTPGQKALVFAGSVQEAKAFAAAFNARGVKAASVDGKTDDIDRLRLLGGTDYRGRRVPSALETGAIDVICNVAVLTEGFDCPALSVCIIACACSTSSGWLQRIGRVLRPEDGIAKPGERATVIDPHGHVWKPDLGLPEAGRVYDLSGKAIRLANDRIALRQCKHCGAVTAPREACARCHTRFPEPPRSTVRAAPMEKVTQAQIDEQRRRRREQFDRLVASAKANGYDRQYVIRTFRQTYGYAPPVSWWPAADAPLGSQRAYWERLVREGRAKGHKSGWVEIKFKAVFGHWPKWDPKEVRDADDPAQADAEA
jgi:DNA repair protein RadD